MRGRSTGILVGLILLSITVLPGGCPPQDNGGPGDPNEDDQQQGQSAPMVCPAPVPGKLVWRPEGSQPADKCYPTVIIVHGLDHDSSNEPEWRPRMARSIAHLIEDENGLPQDNPANDILVDGINIAFWNWGHYPKACVYPCYRAARPAGEELAQKLMKLMEDGIIDPDPARIHLIGYSMGGYVCATAAQTMVLRRRGRIGQLTGLDVPVVPRLPDLVSPWVPIDINPAAFDAVTWYPLVGLDVYPVFSLSLQGPNVIMQEVNDEDEPSYSHATFPQWYIDNKIVRGNWDSWVAVKPQHWGFGGFGQQDASLKLDYSLKCRGCDQVGEIRVPAQPAAAANSTLYDGPFPGGAPLLVKTISSGSIPSMAALTLDAGLVGSGSVWGATIHANRAHDAAAYAQADVAVEYQAKLTVNDRRDCDRGCLPVPFLLSYGGTVEQRLRWAGDDLVLRPTGDPPDADACLLHRCKLLTLDLTDEPPEPELYSKAKTVADAGSSCHESKILCTHLSFHDWLIWVNTGTSAGDMPTFTQQLCVGAADTPLYALTSLTLILGQFSAETSATTVWGPALVFNVEPPDHVRFTPTSPDLYVVRVTIKSLDDDTKASSNVPVFVAGSVKRSARRGNGDLRVLPAAPSPR